MEARDKLRSLGIDLDRLAELCDRWKIAEIALFGSALREDFRPDSDVDLLVTYRPDADWSLLDTVRLDRELAALFGRKVDLNTPGFLGRYFRDQVLAEAKNVYVAA